MDASRAALSLCLVYTTEVVLVNKAYQPTHHRFFQKVWMSGPMPNRFILVGTTPVVVTQQIVFVAIMRFVVNSTSNINANDDAVLMAA